MKLDAFSLQDKVAIVTGCANGIGAGIARGLAEAGADIFGVYNSRKPAEIEAAVRAQGVQFCAHQANLLSPHFDAKQVIDACVKQFGKVDIVVNNAGVCLRAHALEYTKQMWDETLQVNVTALYMLAQAAAAHFAARQARGRIINIASMLSYHGGVNVSAYTASKHAVIGITKVLASDLGKYGINVNAIAPGWIKTNLSAAVRSNPERNSSIIARIPLGDWGEPDDFKGVAVLLASDAGAYINGATIPVDGGYLVR